MTHRIHRYNKGNPRETRGVAAKALLYALAGMVGVVAILLAWLRWDAGRSREEWFEARKGALVAADVRPLAAHREVVATRVRLQSDSGLAVDVRTVRPVAERAPVAVLLILGGHRTGRDAVELIDDAGGLAIVALDYPYHGARHIQGPHGTLSALPRIRQALLDTPPGISLTVDWLLRQPWVDRERIIMVGVSLGVPFAATAAARDARVAALFLVHGAADNRRWLELNLARRLDAGILQAPLATVLYWIACGPAFDTRTRVAAVAPRPVLIVGARDDERTPPGDTERLFEAAHDPKTLRWTEGLHVQPGRKEVIAELLAIVGEELPLR